MNIRDKIIAACRDLARERGFHNLTMDELAARAGVSKRTVYRYFIGKEAMIEATLDAFMAEVALVADQLVQTEKEPARILSGLLNYLFIHGHFVTNPYSFNDLRVYYPNLWQKINRFRLERIVFILDFIHNREESGITSEVDPRIISTVILASIQAVLNPDFIMTNNLNFEETARQLSNLLLNGFIPQ